MNEFIELNEKLYISSEVHFYTIQDLQKETTWSESTLQRLFNNPEFPAADFGRNKIVESHALIYYFFKRREKELDPYWQ